VKTDFRTRKFTDKPDTIFFGTIMGYPKSRIDAKLSVKSGQIYYTEVTDIPMGDSRLIINMQKQYASSREFQSFSSGVSFIHNSTIHKLSASADIGSESARLADFLSKKPAESWRREMELKTGSLK